MRILLHKNFNRNYQKLNQKEKMRAELDAVKALSSTLSEQYAYLLEKNTERAADGDLSGSVLWE